jgi:hypothetical protein
VEFFGELGVDLTAGRASVDEKREGAFPGDTYVGEYRLAFVEVADRDRDRGRPRPRLGALATFALRW